MQPAQTTKGKMKILGEILQSKNQFGELNKSLSALSKVQTAWEKAVRDKQTDLKLSSFFAHSWPSNFQKGVLYISCESSLIANHARFIHDDIIQELSKKGIQNISSLKLYTAKQNNINTSNSEQKKDRVVDAGTLNTLKQFAESCESEALKASTKKLLNRLQEQQTKK